MASHQWLFSKDFLSNSPSRKVGIDAVVELINLQRVSNCIQDMGRELGLPLLCMNTAILFSQRFYVYHPYSVFEKFSIGAAALFLAAKVEEHPRKVEDICKVARKFGLILSDIEDKDYMEDLLCNENTILLTLGFDLKVQHPHQHVLLICEHIKASKHLAKTSYILATYLLHLTNMCLIHKPPVNACVSIYTASKMLSIELPPPRDGKDWFFQADNTLTLKQLEDFTVEFVTILKNCPGQFKSRTLKHLVKKLSMDPSCLALFKPNNAIPTDHLHSTLKEEYSLITSSLQFESKRSRDVNRARHTEAASCSRARPLFNDVGLDGKSSRTFKSATSYNLTPIGGSKILTKEPDNPSNSALPVYTKTEKVINSSVSITDSSRDSSNQEMESNYYNSKNRISNLSHWSSDPLGLKETPITNAVEEPESEPHFSHFKKLKLSTASTSQSRMPSVEIKSEPLFPPSQKLKPPIISDVSSLSAQSASGYVKSSMSSDKDLPLKLAESQSKKTLAMPNQHEQNFPLPQNLKQATISNTVSKVLSQTTDGHDKNSMSSAKEKSHCQNTVLKPSESQSRNSLGDPNRVHRSLLCSNLKPSTVSCAISQVPSQTIGDHGKISASSDKDLSYCQNAVLKPSESQSKKSLVDPNRVRQSLLNNNLKPSTVSCAISQVPSQTIGYHVKNSVSSDKDMNHCPTTVLKPSESHSIKLLADPNRDQRSPSYKKFKPPTVSDTDASSPVFSQKTFVKGSSHCPNSLQIPSESKSRKSLVKPIHDELFFQPTKRLKHVTTMKTVVSPLSLNAGGDVKSQIDSANISAILSKNITQPINNNQSSSPLNNREPSVKVSIPKSKILYVNKRSVI